MKKLFLVILSISLLSSCLPPSSSNSSASSVAMLVYRAKPSLMDLTSYVSLFDQSGKIQKGSTNLLSVNVSNDLQAQMKVINETLTSSSDFEDVIAGNISTSAPFFLVLNAAKPSGNPTFADKIEIDRSVNLRALSLHGGNRLLIKDSDVHIGVFISEGNANSISAVNARLMLDSGRMTGTSISMVQFSPFPDTALQSNAAKRQFYIGAFGEIQQVTPLTIPAGQTVTLDNLGSDWKVSAKSTRGMIMAPTIQVNGILNIENGIVKGKMIIGDGTYHNVGNVHFQSGLIDELNTTIYIAGAPTEQVMVNSYSTFNMYRSPNLTFEDFDTVKTISAALTDLKNKLPKISIPIVNAGKFIFNGGEIQSVDNTGIFSMSDVLYKFSVQSYESAAGKANIGKAIDKLPQTAEIWDVQNSGKFTISGGNIRNLQNNSDGMLTVAGGELHNVKNSGIVTFNSLDNAMIDFFESKGAGNTINLQTGKTLWIGTLSVDNNTTINLVLRNLGVGIPILRIENTPIDLSASTMIIFAGNADKILKGSSYKLTEKATSSILPATIKIDSSLIKSSGGAPKLGTDIKVSIVDHQIVLDVESELKTSGFTNATKPAWVSLACLRNSKSKTFNGMMGEMSGRFSEDINAVTLKEGDLSFTTSQDDSRGYHFVGMNLTAETGSKLGTYVGYTSKTNLNDFMVNEFGLFSVSKVAGMNILSRISYGAQESLFDTFEMASKSLLAQSKVSYAFDMGLDMKLVPNFVVGCAQLLSQKSSFADSFHKFDFAIDSGEVFSGFGVDFVSDFIIDTLKIQAFGTLSILSELTSRQLKVVQTGETNNVNGTETTFLMGGKITMDHDCHFYSTVGLTKMADEPASHSLTFGVNLKL